MKQAKTVPSNSDILLQDGVNKVSAAYRDLKIVEELLEECSRANQSERVRVLSEFKIQKSNTYQSAQEWLSGTIGTIIFSPIRSELEGILGSTQMIVRLTDARQRKSWTLRVELIDAICKVISGEQPKKRFKLKPEAARLATGIYGLRQNLETIGIDFSFSVSEECVSIEIKPLKNIAHV